MFLSCGMESVIAQAESDSIWSFAEVRMDADGDNELDYYGKQATITGIANVNSGLLHEYYLQVFIQNDSAGMSVFSTDIDTPFEAGDSLVVHGRIEQYNGLTEIHADSYRVFKAAADKPGPISLIDAIDQPSQFLGMLVRGEGRIIEKGNTFNGKYLRLKPAGSDGNMMVYVSNFHRYFDDFRFGLLSIGDEISVTGIITESNPDFPDERIFKLFLRSPDDLEYASLPKKFLYAILGTVLILGLIIIIWISLLKRNVTAKTNEIRTSLEEKEMLLREIHHRVKNSLSIVSGLIDLQLHEIHSEEAKNVLQSSRNRIHSVALIHDKLYRTESLAQVELDVYIRDLVNTIHGTFNEYQDSVKLDFDLDSVELETDRVIPCGLLINELAVNAYKHAFKKNKQGRLIIRLKDQGNTLRLDVSDNGPGLPKNYYDSDEGNLGTLLIHSFTEKLNATMDVSENKNGTTFSFNFPKEN